MRNAIAWAAAAGIASAGLHAASILGAWAAMTLGFFAPLPVFLVGLSPYGRLASVAAAVAALAAGALGASGLSALGYLGVVGLPALGLSTLAMRGSTHGRASDLGTLVTWLTGAGLALVGGLLAALFVVAADPAAAIEKVVQGLYGQLPQAPAEMVPQGEALWERIARLMPGAVVLSVMVMHAVNACLAQAVLTARAIQGRAAPSLGELALPAWLAVIAAGAVLLAGLAPAPADLVGINLLMVALLPMALLGLSVVHVFANRRGNPRVWLLAVYALIILLGWPILLVGALGFVEQWLGLRQRMGGGPSGT